jgi:uncharacterized protein (DUF934 family)
MRQLIKDNQIISDTWTILTKEECAETIPAGNVLVPVKVWLANHEALVNRQDIGIWFEGDDEPEKIGAELTRFPVIAVNFPKFADGRGYSIARLIKERYQFTGELRAIGDVLRDQLYFLQRCGFNSFQVRADRIDESAIESFKDFSTVYQAAADDTPALFHKR